MVISDMPQKRNLKRESLEVYLLYLLMGNRPMFNICGMLLLVCSVFARRVSLLAGNISLLVAVLLLLAVYSDRFIRFLAKAGAWIGTIRSSND